MQNIKVMADYCATAVWDADNYFNLQYNEINLTDDLVADLKKWVEYYELNCFNYDPTNPKYKSFNYDQFNIDGLKLAHRVKQQNPNACVIYFVEDLSDPFLVTIHEFT